MSKVTWNQIKILDYHEEHKIPLNSALFHSLMLEHSGFKLQKMVKQLIISSQKALTTVFEKWGQTGLIY